MKFKYDKSKGLLFFINPWFPFKGYTFMNFCGIMLTRDKKLIDRMSDNTVRHEKAHSKQIVEMLVILFYIWYVLEWFIKLLIYRNAHSAYRNISFEREARYVAEHPEYKRKLFTYKWLKWIL